MRILVVGWILAAILFIFGVTFTYLTFRNGQASPAGSSSLAPFTIVVDANGMSEAAPDVAHVSLGVDTPAPTAAEATANNSTAMAAIIRAVKALGVPDKDVRTTGFSIAPVYATPRPGETAAPTITGYRVRNTILVTMENVQDVGKVLDGGLRAGANGGVNISFGLKNDTAVQQQALHDAFQQAKSKAEAIAASAGLKLSGPYSITESSTQPPRPLSPAVGQASTASAATPIETGQLTVNAHLQVTFQYSH